MKLKIGFVSLGCPKNLTDTETMLGILKNGCEIVTKPEEADIIIVNTCGFIESAKQESIDAILEMARFKESGRLKKLIVTGCLAQRYAQEMTQELSEVDAVVGTGSYYEIETVVRQVMQGEKPVLLGEIDRPAPEMLPRALATPDYTAYLKIADGCDNHCTYCIIPKLRGKYRSREMENIVEEARGLAAQGVRELVLIAQDTTQYGTDLYQEKRLPALLHALSGIDGIEWLRLLYCYPEAVTDGLIAEMAQNPKVCKYIDIPMQHASDRVLKKMGRRNSLAMNRALMQKLRGAMPDIVVRSTFIVGFPGETEEDFAILREFIKEARFDRLGVFPYSAEEGTPAAVMPHQVDEQTKQHRQSELMLLQQGISKEINQGKIGRELRVLCEGESGGRYIGRSEGDAPDIDGKVMFIGGDVKEGQLVTVKVWQAKEYDVEGETV